MMLAERCKRCNSRVFLETDERHGFKVKQCFSGHTLSYLHSDGEVVEVHEQAPRAQLSTREWAQDLLSDALVRKLEDEEAEGAYGAWE